MRGENSVTTYYKNKRNATKSEENGKITIPLLYYHSHKRQTRKQEKKTKATCVRLFFPPTFAPMNPNERMLCVGLWEGHGVDLLGVWNVGSCAAMLQQPREDVSSSNLVVGVCVRARP